MLYFFYIFAHQKHIFITNNFRNGKFYQMPDSIFQIHLEKGMKVGVCSGGAGDFAEAAKFLGCDVFITGEASWGDVIAAENVGMKMIQAGHYETETFGVRALAEAMTTQLGVETVFIDRMPRA